MLCSEPPHTRPEGRDAQTEVMIDGRLELAIHGGFQRGGGGAGHKGLEVGHAGWKRVNKVKKQPSLRSPPEERDMDVGECYLEPQIDCVGSIHLNRVA